MTFAALLLEGNTETIFFECLLPHIQLQDSLWFSRKLTELIDDSIHENKIWLVDCRGDGSVVSYIRKNAGVFVRQDFDYLFLIRDYYPDNKPPTPLCKGDLCGRILTNIPAQVVRKYGNRIFVNLSVEEIEAWFFTDDGLFQNLSPILTVDYINQNYKNILNMNPEYIKRPSARIKQIIEENLPNRSYTKKEDELRFVIHGINMDTCLAAVRSDYAQSFHRLVTFLRRILE
jgi:hypothetical protein